MRAGRGERIGALPRGAFYGLLFVAVVTLPPWISAAAPRWLASSYGMRTVGFELLGFLAATVFVLVAAIEWRRYRGRPFADFLPVLVPLVVGLHYATLLSEYSSKPFDYDCYEYAARALRAGANPYLAGLNYLYPPLTAQVLAGVYGLAASIAGTVGFAPGEDARWDAVFYLYQCAQLALVVLLAVLAERFARAVGIERRWAPLLVGALLLFDNPLLRTLRHGQVNLWVLDLSLVTLLLARRIPVAAGAALAIAIHVKLYPVVLLLPLVVGRCWRAVLWTGLAFGGVVAWQTDGFGDWTTWRQFTDFYTRVYPGEIAFRNASFHSLAVNTLRFAFGVPPSESGAAVRAAASVFSLAMAAWLLLRVLARARRQRGPDGAAGWILADGADALAFSLLISQSAWEHHYVLALPLAIRAVAEVGRARPLAVIGALFLMLGMPTFDLFPLGYHRAVGLVMLLVLTAPGRGRGERGAPSSTRSPPSR